jgi:hypothetical protein
MRNKVLFAVVFLGLAVAASAQVSFPNEDKILQVYDLSSSPETLPKGAKLNTIDFGTAQYAVEGYFTKGVLTEGLVATFYDTQSVPKVILKGVVSYQAGRLFIRGVREEDAQGDSGRTYGEFMVSNTPDKLMVYKAKKAGPLEVEDVKIEYYCGYYDSCPTTVSLVSDPNVTVDGPAVDIEKPYIRVPLQTNELSGGSYTDIPQLLMKAGKDALIEDKDQAKFGKRVVLIEYKDLYKFEGHVIPSMNQAGIVFFTLLDGEMTFQSGVHKSIKVTETADGLQATFKRNPSSQENNPIVEEIYIVNDKTAIPVGSYWKPLLYYENASKVILEYQNKSKFEGVVEYNKEDGKLTRMEGTVSYPNGDKFVGDILHDAVGAFCTRGTTYFNDGTKWVGNWLAQYKLTSDEMAEVQKKSNPSDAKKLAEKFAYRHSHEQYDLKENANGWIPYFRVTGELAFLTKNYCKYLVYEKETGKYYGYYDREHLDWIECAIIVDKEGKHITDIEYDPGIRVPRTLTKYEWYPNGSIKKLMAYVLPDNRLQVVCNFFSDGTLRSAYWYEKGNNGNLIIRKSKEAHPTLGGYTCKLYDLDGNYERAIEWNIGETKNFWGDKIPDDMAPWRFDLSNYTKAVR